jgi:phosphohistidine phosphatase
MATMKRTLVLIRHAKSDWNIAGQPDFDRTLNERGKSDAPIMGKRLLEKNLKPDLIISSSAKRAAKTANLLAKELHYDKNNIQYLDKLYHASPARFEEVITEVLDDSVQTLFMVAHNPGISEYAYSLLNHLPIPDLPTCGMVGITFEADCWSNFAAAKHQLLFVDYPKNQ